MPGPLPSTGGGCGEKTSIEVRVDKRQQKNVVL